MSPRRVLTGLLAALLLTLGLTSTAGPLAGPAEAARGPAALTIDTLEPGVPTDGATLRVAGRVSNTGQQELRNVEVRLRLSATHLGSRGELAAVLAGSVTSRDGEAVVSEQVPDLGVGQTEPFLLTRETAELSQLTEFGVYVLGIEVLAERDSGFGRVALVRTLLPWVPQERDFVATEFTWVWPLVGRPVRLADGLFTDESLATDLGPDGRLTRLLEAGEQVAAAGGLTWALDPELVAAVADMSDGYQVRQPNGQPVPGTGSEAATSWLTRLRASTADRPVIPLAYGDADLTAMARAGFLGSVRTAFDLGRTTLAEQLPSAQLLSETAWPVDGYAPRRTLAALRRAGISSVLLDGRAVPPEIDLSYTPTGRAQVSTGAGRLTGLLAEPSLADLLASRSGTPLLDSQRFVAETAMIASELPSGPDRSIVVLPPRRWNPDPAFLQRLVSLVTGAPWIAPTGLRELAATPPPEVDRLPVQYPAEQRAAELPRTYLLAVDGMRDSTAVFAKILTEPEAYVPGLERSALLLQSSWWRGRSGRANRLFVERDYLRDLRQQVRIQPGNFIFSSRRGTFAVTVANGLDQAVLVRLRLQPQTTRLRLGPITPAPIGPRQKQQVEVAATAVAPGPVLVDASLHAEDGTPYGQPVLLRITITEYGTVALYITIAAAVVLFLAAGIRVLRRVTARSAAEEGSDEQP